MDKPRVPGPPRRREHEDGPPHPRQRISAKFLRPETQEALGEEGYDKGAEILYNFFAKELAVYDTEELHPVGRQILECFKNRGSVEDYCYIIPRGRAE